MSSNVAEYVRKCVTCAPERLVRHRRQGKLQIDGVKRRFEMVAMDVVEISPASVSGNRKVLVIMDLFTRYVVAEPIALENAEVLAKVLLEKWFLVFGPPECLLNDGGPVMTATVLTTLCGRLGISRSVTSAFHPSTNGAVEKFNSTLCRDTSVCFEIREMG